MRHGWRLTRIPELKRLKRISAFFSFQDQKRIWMKIHLYVLTGFLLFYVTRKDHHEQRQGAGLKRGKPDAARPAGKFPHPAELKNMHAHRRYFCP